MPGAWTEHLNDDELWEALVACDPWRDPFALLGALDIALGRQHDERYRHSPRKPSRSWSRRNSPVLMALIPMSCCRCGQSWCSTASIRLESGALRPPCWKRMCAWMQAGFLSRLTQRFRLELESFREWAWEIRHRLECTRTILDLRHEPMYRAAEMSPRALREEVIGRLVLIRERHKAAGTAVPGSNSIDEAVSGLAARRLPLGWALPGPLDGHYRPAETRDPQTIRKSDIQGLQRTLPIIQTGQS